MFHIIQQQTLLFCCQAECFSSPFSPILSLHLNILQRCRLFFALFFYSCQCVNSSSFPTFIQNRSLDRYSGIRCREDNFLPSFIFLQTSCFSFILDVILYTFEHTTNHLLNNPMKSIQDQMTNWGFINLPPLITQPYPLSQTKEECHFPTIKQNLFKRTFQITPFHLTRLFELRKSCWELCDSHRI